MSKFISLIVTPFRIIGQMVSRVTRFGGKAPKISLAAKLAWLLFLLLIVWDIGVVWYKLSQGQNWSSWLLWLLMILSAIFLPILLYWAVRLYNFEWPSLYDEIDECWDAFHQWLIDEDLEYEDVPIFLVIGSDSIRHAKTLHSGSRYSLNGLPSGAGNWMHWFGNENGVYLHLKDCCVLSGLIDKAKKQRPGNQNFESIQTQTLVVDNDMYWDSNESDSGFGLPSGGLNPDDTIPAEPYLSLNPDDVFTDEGLGDDMDSDQGGGESVESAEDAEEHDDHRVDYLAYVCQLLRKSKAGHVPIQGVLIVLPFDIFQRDTYCVKFADAARTDLDVLTEKLDVDFPVSVLFGSMEFDKGFAQLKKAMLSKMGEKNAKQVEAGRFGVGVDVAEIPRVDGENFKVFSERLNQYFRSWVMSIYRTQDRLSKQIENRQIYRLMANIRIKFRYQLVKFLKTSIAEVEKSPSSTGPFLTGCFFATTSDTDRGFLQGFFVKTREFAQTSKWSNTAIKRDQRVSAFAGMLFMMSILMIIGAVVFAYLSFSNPDFFDWIRDRFPWIDG